MLVSPVCHASIVYLRFQTLGTAYTWVNRLAVFLGANPACPGLDPLKMRVLPSALSVLKISPQGRAPETVMVAGSLPRVEIR